MRTPLLLIVSLVLLAACGGTPAAPTAGAPAETPQSRSDPAAPAGTAVPAATPAPIGTPAPVDDDDMPTDPAPVGTLCHLLTLEELETATGLPAEPANEVEGQCTWLLKGPDAASAGVVTLVRDTGGVATLSVYRGAFEGDDVPGIGQDAYWVEETNTLFFVHGGYAYTLLLMIFGEDPDDALGITRSLALSINSRL
jgi:hypothetical protein